jgi:uncharacterized protein YehS (DUF1456 family)
MTNNDIFRRLRYIFDLDDQAMIKTFALVNKEFPQEKIINWLRKDEDEKQVSLYDIDLAAFLNGLIILKRGKKDDKIPKPEKTLINNLILRKLKIALNLKDNEMIEIFNKADLQLSKHELSAFFRHPDQKQYRLCKDQFLRNFLMGLQLKHRPNP